MLHEHSQLAFGGVRRIPLTTLKQHLPGDASQLPYGKRVVYLHLYSRSMVERLKVARTLVS